MRHVTWPIPTGWFALVVALSGVALLFWPGRSWNALVVVELAVVAVFVADFVVCTAPGRLEVGRDVPATTTVGESAELSWLVANPTRNAARVTVDDALWPSLNARRRRVTLRLRPGARNRVRTTFTPMRRGRFPLDAVTVRVTGPLRLASKQARRSLPGSIRVMPAWPSRAEVARRVPRLLDGSRTVRRAGAGAEFDQLRDYVPDDDFRRVDWAATLRLQRPVVKQYRAERNQHLVVLLDNGRVMAGTVGGVSRVEHAMDAVLAVTDTAARLGDRVGLISFDRQVRSIVVPDNRRSQLGRVAEAMYLLEPELAESAYSVAFSAAAARWRRRSLYIVLTDLAEATVEQGLLPALPILTRRHVVLVAAVQDPDVGRWADQGSLADSGEAYRQAAAVAALSRRARSAARLRAAGAVVLDAAPGRLGVELVDVYLALKASGRL